ncbi:hypothetical protein RZS08_00135, partial [Arthrospira platensis SPKY1]|nr:hypothetical protein [Arthrospira platensis SPKY1]
MRFAWNNLHSKSDPMQLFEWMTNIANLFRAYYSQPLVDLWERYAQNTPGVVFERTTAWRHFEEMSQLRYDPFELKLIVEKSDQFLDIIWPIMKNMGEAPQIVPNVKQSTDSIVVIPKH